MQDINYAEFLAVESRLSRARQYGRLCGKIRPLRPRARAGQASQLCRADGGSSLYASSSALFVVEKGGYPDFPVDKAGSKPKTRLSLEALSGWTGSLDGRNPDLKLYLAIVIERPGQFMCSAV